MSERNMCTKCGETLILNGINKAVQDVISGLGGLQGIFAGHWNEENYSHGDIDDHIDNDEIMSVSDVQEVSVGGNFSGSVGNIMHGSAQRCTHNHNLADLTEKSHISLTDKGDYTHDEIDDHINNDEIMGVSDVQGVSVGGNFSGSVGNIMHGSTQRCTHNHNLTNLTEKSHTSLTDKGNNTHAQIDTHITEDVIKTATNVQGVSVGGDISGTVGDAKDKLINATLYYSVSGWALSQTVWAIWGVPLSNTTATLSVSFYVNKGGNFKFMICYGNLQANSGYTMSCKFTSAYAVHGGTTVNLTASADWDIPLGAYDVRLQDKCSNTLTIPDNAVVGIYFRKDDNAGGASGDVYVSGIYLERQ